MMTWKALGSLVLGGACVLGCSGDPETSPETPTPEPKTEIAGAAILDLKDVAAKPEPYEWFDFRPNIKKLILTGAAETQHIAILWYTVTDGGVALHYHAKTESVYVIEGTQADAKGTYDTGTVYFNPPGSGHQVTDSSGFFLLAYAAPPDFVATDLIDEAYTPIRIDTTDPKLTTTHAFEEQKSGASVFEPSLDASGGLAASFIELEGSARHDFVGNYFLVLDGACLVEDVKVSAAQLVVGEKVEPQPYSVSAAAGASCLGLGVAFRD